MPELKRSSTYFTTASWIFNEFSVSFMKPVLSPNAHEDCSWVKK